MYLTDEQVNYFAEVSFIRGVMAERMGLIGNPRGLICEDDFHGLVESLRTLEIIEDGLCMMVSE